jgi:methylaspartate mutase epsilon subunit
VSTVTAARAASPVRGSFGAFVARAQSAGHLVVQPRMGMSDPRQMRAGLLATREAAPAAVGTITLDSYTRVNDNEAARRALAEGAALNGYPIVAHGEATTRAVLDGVSGPGFPVQVRHGSADPRQIFRALAEAGLDATEGGPVSYCLPYSRTPLARSVDNWTRCAEGFARLRDHGLEPHLETFGGCMMGQLCPPSMLVAISVLEAEFFHHHGLRSLSLSYAQQTNAEQDEEAIRALRVLAGELLPGADWHVVVYAYMGVYPRTPLGATLLLEEAARLAVRSGAARLIVKTTAEAHRIPQVAENVAALRSAATVAAQERHGSAGRHPAPDTGVLAEARALVDAVHSLSEDPGHALVEAFARGLLDVPFCLHPDNAGRARGCLDADGRLVWSELGALPLAGVAPVSRSAALTSGGLLEALSYVARRFDRPTADQLRIRIPIAGRAAVTAAAAGTSLESAQ